MSDQAPIGHCEHDTPTHERCSWCLKGGLHIIGRALLAEGLPTNAETCFDAAAHIEALEAENAALQTTRDSADWVVRWDDIRNKHLVKVNAQLTAARDVIEAALIQISGGLCYKTAEAKHAQLLDAQKTLAALRAKPEDEG